MAIMLRQNPNGAARFSGLSSLCLAASVFIAVPAIAQDQPVSFKGKWHLDIAQSSGQPPFPKSISLEVTVDDGKNYASTRTIVGADGKTTIYSLHASYDGKPYQIEGAPQGQTAALTHVTNTSFQIEFRFPDNSDLKVTCTFSTDRNTVTCEGTDTDAKGIGSPTKVVWVRD